MNRNRALRLSARSMVARIVFTWIVVGMCANAEDKVMIDFDANFAGSQIESRGAKTTLAAAGAQITFPKNAKRPGAFIRPPAGVIWNLCKYNQVEFSFSNPGTTPVRVFCRVDNGNADGVVNCATADAVIGPGAKGKVIVPFVTSKVWDFADKRSGFRFNSDHVISVLVSAESGGEDVRIDLEGVRASVAPPPAMPEWLGRKPPVPGEWIMTFEDDFDGKSLDPARWTIPDKKDDGKGGTFPLEFDGMGSWWDGVSVHVAKNAYVENGCLVLKTDKPNDMQISDPKLKNRKYRSSVVTTFGKFAQKYGYFESRMKLPSALGMWPAFWLMPDRGKDAGIWWKRQSTHDGGMEFDIMEHLVRFGPFRYNIAMHWNGYEKDHKFVSTDNIYIQNDKDGFLTSGLLWEPGTASYYCNGALVAVWKNDRISSVPEYIMYTMPVGGWGTDGIVEDEKLPALFIVDYVRVWQKKEWIEPAATGGQAQKN